MVSLAVGTRRHVTPGSRRLSLLVYAGVNEPPAAAEEKKGGKGGAATETSGPVNRHLRVFAVEEKSMNAATGKRESMGSGDVLPPRVSEVSRTQLLTMRGRDAYQRRLHLSTPPVVLDVSSSTGAGVSSAGGSSSPSRSRGSGATGPDGAGQDTASLAAAQLGVVTTGFATDSQLAIFDVAPTGSGTPRPRGHPVDLPREANDVDVITCTADDSGPRYRVAYCTDYELFVASLPAGAPAGTTSNAKGGMAPASTETPAFECVYEQPDDEGAGSGPASRPRFHFVRFLTPTFLIALTNLPKPKGGMGGGIVLQAFRLPPATVGGPTLVGDGVVGAQKKTRLALSVKLPRHAAQGTAFAVRNLSPPIVVTSGSRVSGATQGQQQSQAQFLVAVAALDHSILLYQLDHTTLGDVELLARPRLVRTLRNVHEGAMRALAFSVFVPPTVSSSNKTAGGATSRTQVVRLASISTMASTVVVHAIPLKKVFDKSSKTAAASSGKKKGAAAAAAKAAAAATGSLPARMPRYVVDLPAQSDAPVGAAIFMAVAMALLALFFQAYLELKGVSPPVLGAQRFAPASWTAPLRRGPVIVPGSLLADLRGDESRRLVIREDGTVDAPAISVDVMPDAEDAKSKQDEKRRTWEDLAASEKEVWRQRLKEAGHWVESLGDNVFKGVLFGELAGAAGRMAAGA